MSRRCAGTLFICIAAMLFISKYITAAIFGSNATIWTSETFDILLNSLGNTLNYLSLISLLIGISYIVWAEVIELKKKG